MEELVSSFSQLNISEKKIINKIIIENNEMDDLIGSFEKINISNLDEIKKIDINLTENFQKTVIVFINYFKILQNKGRCNVGVNFIMPKWIY
jgi:hypothetical protein